MRPHPHIGLATVTWLFEGAILHRDSIGSRQVIRPGDVNWMTAGRGIVHSERTPAPEREAGHRLHGLQTWVALPLDAEETEPAFEHWPADSLPRWRAGDAELTVVAGEAFGRRSPVRVFGPTLYCALRLEAGARVAVPPEHAERALYAVSGALAVDDETLAARSARPACARPRSRDRGPRGLGGDAARRGGARRTPAHVLELRLQPPRPHRAGRTRLDRAAPGQHPRGIRLDPPAQPQPITSREMISRWISMRRRRS